MEKQKKNSLGINFLMNVILTMSSFIFPLITFPYVSRVLGAEGYGKIQLAIAVVNYFILFAQLGIPTYGVRACAIVRDDRRALSRTTHELLVISLVVTAVAYAVLFVLVAAVPKFAQERSLYLITSAGVLLNTLGVEWLFKAVEQYTYITVRSLLFKVISVVAMFLLVHRQEHYVIYAGISVLAAYGSQIMNLTQIPKYVECRPLGQYNFRRHIKPVLVFFGMTCATTIYTQLDSVMLGFLATDADVGYYSVAVKIKIMLASVVTAVSAVLLPRVSYYFEQNKLEEFWSVISKTVRSVILVAIPLAVYFMIFAKNGIYFLSGDAYAPSVLPMVVIMPALLCIGLSSLMGIQVLVPSGRENDALRSYILGAVVNCVANLILIPGLKALGAAIGTLIAEVCVVVYQAWLLRKELGSSLFSRSTLLTVAATAAASAASFWVARLPLSDFLTLVVSACIFFGVYVLILHLSKEPLLAELEKQALAKLRRTKD